MPGLGATQKILIQQSFLHNLPRVPNGVWRCLCFCPRMRCVIFFDTLPKGFGDSFVAPHLLPGTNCIMNPERMPVSAPSNECPRCVVKWMTLKRGGRDFREATWTVKAVITVWGNLDLDSWERRCFFWKVGTWSSSQQINYGWLQVALTPCVKDWSYFCQPSGVGVGPSPMHVRSWWLAQKKTTEMELCSHPRHP